MGEQHSQLRPGGG